jgi:hypothetical protein
LDLLDRRVRNDMWVGCLESGKDRIASSSTLLIHGCVGSSDIWCRHIAGEDREGLLREMVSQVWSYIWRVPTNRTGVSSAMMVLLLVQKSQAVMERVDVLGVERGKVERWKESF